MLCIMGIFFYFFFVPYGMYVVPNGTHVCFVCNLRRLSRLGRGGGGFGRPPITLRILYKSCQNVWVY